MDANVLRECLTLAMSNRMTFPETVRRMDEIGVERYDADLTRMEKRYYAADGATHSDVIPLSDGPQIHRAFSGDGVRAAIEAIRRQEIDYPEFLRRIMAAGAVSYTVYLDGRKAIYFGRAGDFHIEPFPTAN
jgi:uncharacterized protein YbcV (DUF1398 family)